MKIKTTDLIRAPLDWATATALDIPTFIHEGRFMIEVPNIPNRHLPSGWGYRGFRPSTLGDTVIDIIKRESIRVTPDKGATYVEQMWFAGCANEDGDEFNGEGPTLRIAVCRCFVASKLGSEVEVPDELVKEKWDEHFGREDD